MNEHTQTNNMQELANALFLVKDFNTAIQYDTTEVNLEFLHIYYERMEGLIAVYETKINGIAIHKDSNSEILLRSYYLRQVMMLCFEIVEREFKIKLQADKSVIDEVVTFIDHHLNDISFDEESTNIRETIEKVSGAIKNVQKYLQENKPYDKKKALKLLYKGAKFLPLKRNIITFSIVITIIFALALGLFLFFYLRKGIWFFSQF